MSNDLSVTARPFFAVLRAAISALILVDRGIKIIYNVIAYNIIYTRE